jgi:hypothetical protein
MKKIDLILLIDDDPITNFINLQLIKKVGGGGCLIYKLQ